MGNKTETFHTVYLLLGSNLGDKLNYLKYAVKRIDSKVGEIIKISSVYESESWGFEGSSFFNQVLIVKTKLSPNSVLDIILNIELETGRTRTIKGYQSRVLDIDILFYDNIVLNSDNLIIPHPLLHQRRFTLLPLKEISPSFKHPVLNTTIKELYDNCKDEGKVWLLKY